MKFLIITPPAILLRVTKRSIEDFKALGPFQNLDVGLLLNEAYGHTFTKKYQGLCFNTYSHGCWHEPKSCLNWKTGGKEPTCLSWQCGGCDDVTQ